MSHYFVTSEDSGERHSVFAKIWGREYEFVSADRVFSSHRLDLGTSVMLKRTSPPGQHVKRILDLGCGYGPIAIALANECPWAHIDAVDVNQLALQLTLENAKRYGVSQQVSVAEPDDLPLVQYDEIWSNPPIRIGKEALHTMLLKWLNRLAPNGNAWLVVGKNLGADPLQKWLTDQGFNTVRVGSAKGFRVFNSRRAE